MKKFAMNALGKIDQYIDIDIKYNLFGKCMRPESSSCRARNSKIEVPLAVFANTAYLRR